MECVYENRKGLTYTDLVEFLKYLNRSYVKLENFNPEDFVKEVNKEKIVFRINKEEYKNFIELLKERHLI
jgi:pyruvate/2-oxoacid:ferredoxin oxidoreductase beta subunit